MCCERQTSLFILKVVFTHAQHFILTVYLGHVRAKHDGGTVLDQRIDGSTEALLARTLLRNGFVNVVRFINLRQ